MKRLFVAAMIICLSAAAATAVLRQTAGVGPGVEFQRINDLINANENVAAAAEMLKFIANHPKDPLLPNVMMSLGRVYERMARYPDAEQVFKRLYNEMPDNPRAPEALVAAAQNAQRDNRPNDAIQLYETAFNRYPDSGVLDSARFDLSSLYERKGDGDAAVKLLKEASRRGGPFGARADSELALLYLRLENYYEAETAALKYLKNNPGDNSMRITLGRIYMSESKFDQALQLYRELSEKQPHDQGLEDLLFQAYGTAGRLDELADALRKEKKKNPNDLEPVRKLARFYQRNKQSIEALNELEIIVAREPNNYDDAVTLASLYYENQWAEKARQTLDTVLAKQPDYTPALQALGEMSYAQKRMDEAKRAWEKAVRFNPEEEQSYQRLANIFWAHNMISETAQLFEDGRRRIGRPALFARELADLYFHQMRYRDSLKEYMLLTAQSTGDGSLRDRIFNLLDREEFKEEGYGIIEESAKKWPDNIDVGLLSAEILFMQGKMEQGIKRLETLNVALPNNSGLYSEIGRRLLAGSEPTRAAALFELAADREKGDKAGRLLQAARAWQAADDIKHAEKNYRRIIDEAPDAPGADEAVFRLAGIALDAGDIPRARALFSQLVTEYPLSAYVGDAFVAEAKTELRLGEFDQARQAFDALADNPRTRRYADEIFFYRAELKLLDLKTQDAAQLYSQLVSQYPESRYVGAAINRLLFLGDVADADPISVQAYIEAEKKMLSGDTSSAEGMLRGLEVSLPAGPLPAYTRFRLGELLEVDKRLTESAEFFKAAADGEGLPELRPSANVRLASVLARLGRREEALKRYQAVITEDPRGYWAQRARAEVRQLQPQDRQAQ